MIKIFGLFALLGLNQFLFWEILRYLKKQFPEKISDFRELEPWDYSNNQPFRKFYIALHTNRFFELNDLRVRMMQVAWFLTGVLIIFFSLLFLPSSRE